MPDFLRFVWDLEDDPEGNAQHIAEHGVSVDEVEEVLRSADEEEFSRTSGRPLVRGFTHEGRYLIVIFEWVDDDSIYPVTAFEPDED